MKNKVIHKRGTKTLERYVGLGSYNAIPTPLCDGANGLYRGNTYIVTHFWKNVTCKRCINKQKRLREAK